MGNCLYIRVYENLDRILRLWRRLRRRCVCLDPSLESRDSAPPRVNNRRTPAPLIQAPGSLTPPSSRVSGTGRNGGRCNNLLRIVRLLDATESFDISPSLIKRERNGPVPRHPRGVTKMTETRSRTISATAIPPRLPPPPSLPLPPGVLGQFRTFIPHAAPSL